MSAVFSDDMMYRYRLGRSISDQSETCCFIMLNPSVAGESKDDPTIRRCKGFAKRLNCGKLVVVNLFAYCATDPDELKALTKAKAVGPENDYFITHACTDPSTIVICAWGAQGKLFKRDEEVLKLLASYGLRAFALKVNASSPGHPLYLRKDSRLVPYP